MSTIIVIMPPEASALAVVGLALVGAFVVIAALALGLGYLCARAEMEASE